MLKGILLVVAMGALVACQDTGMVQSLSGNNVIYGEDDRLDLYQVTNEMLLERARSTVALVNVNRIRQSAEAGDFTLVGIPLGDRINLCPSERFKEQYSVADCSGSLVGPDLVLTAAHCVRHCASTAMVFDFAVNEEGGSGSKTVKKDNIYLCQEVVEYKFESGAGEDYALLRLDRPVVNRKPLEIRREGSLSVGDGLVVIGHPSGLPTKVAGGAKVREVDHRPYFVANLDTYGGNSGSAVFNEVTGEIEGILVRGEQDYESNGVCLESFRCADGECMGEHVVKVGLLADAIPLLSESSDVISSNGFER